MIEFEKQITDYHCVPAVLRMLVPGAKVFTQEEIGYMVNTTEKGTDVNDVRPFLKMMGYRLCKAYVKWMAEGIIIDYKHKDGDDHWGIIVMGGIDSHIVYDPYKGHMTGVKTNRVNNYYKLEEL